MLFRLCEITGHPHPDYLAPYLTTKQLADWDHYGRNYGYRDDRLWGLLTWAIAQVHSGDELRMEHFMPYYDPDHPPVEEVADSVKSFFEKARKANR